jgi:two-component system sensor histidine kinase ChvG
VRVALQRTSARSEPEGEEPFDRVVITVDDDGPGIPPHSLERIFERFYTDRPSQGFGQNSGLGLSISRQIVEAHGGRIWACNRPAELGSVRIPSAEGDNFDEATRHGAGARFVVELPAFSA